MIRFTPLLGSLWLALVCSVPSIAQFAVGKLVSSTKDQPMCVQAADFDRDGDIDVLIKDMSSTTSVFWVPNDGKGNFGAARQLPTVSQGGYVSLQAFDYDNDGDVDVMASFASAKKIYLWKNQGTGTFTAPTLVTTSVDTFHAINAVDLDNDGDKDVAVSVEYNKSFWLRNDLQQDQWTVQPFPVLVDYADYIDVVDMNGDGVLDYLSCADNRTNSIWLNGKEITKSYINEFAYLKATDLDRDGDLDVVASRATSTSTGGRIVWLEHKGSTYIDRVIEDSSFDYNALTIVDADADGDDDIFASCWFGCGTDFFKNMGAGTFTRTRIATSSGAEEGTLIAADINGDGSQDLIRASTPTGNAVGWYMNQIPQFSGIQSDFRVKALCEGDSTQFSQTARGKNLVAWQWDFGDGSAVSTRRNPAHRYATSGAFNVTLTVKNAAGETSALTQAVTVIAAPGPKPEQIFPACENSLTITLDPTAYNYTWYAYKDVDWPGSKGNTYSLWTTDRTTVYVIKTDLVTGCSSLTRDSITGKYYGYPKPPGVTNASSYTGAAKLLLEASPAAKETVEWYSDGGLTTQIGTGNYYSQQFTTTTSVFAVARNEGGCRGTATAAMATVLPQAVPAPSFSWGNAGKAESFTEAYSVATNKNGEPLLYGSWYTGRIFAGSDILEPTTNRNQRFLIKYDKSGNALGAVKIVECPNDQNITFRGEILVDKSDNIYIAGQFYYQAQNNWAIIGGTTVTIPDLTRSITIVAKLDPQGKMLWYQQFHATNGVSWALNKQDQLVIVGEFDTSTKIGTKTFTGTPHEPFMVRFNTNGTIAAGISGLVIKQGPMVIDSKGNIYTRGYSLINGNTALMICKYTAAGSITAFMDVTSAGYFAEIDNMVIDSNDRLIFSGNIIAKDTKMFNSVLGKSIGNGNSNFVACMKTDGTPVWVNSYRFFPWGSYSDMKIAADNTFFLAGPTNGDFNIGNANVHADGYSSSVIKFSTNGDALWAKTILGNSAMSTCTPDNEGGVYVGGAFTDYTKLDDITLRSNTNFPSPTVNYNMLIARVGFAFNADFKYGTACASQAVRFSDGSTAGNGKTLTKWTWNFGDGGTAAVQNPTHTYTAAGNYTVTLTIEDNDGNTRTQTQTVAVANATPVGITLKTPANFDALCSGRSVTYQQVVQNGGTKYTTHWYVDNVDMKSYTDATTLTLTPTKNQTISVDVESFDQFCATDRTAEASVAQVVYNVPAQPQIATNATALCENETTTLTVVADYANYRWANGATTKSITVSAADNRSLYYASVADVPQCMSTPSNNITLTFLKKPAAPTVTPSSVDLCDTETATLTASGNYKYYHWSNGEVTKAIAVTAQQNSTGPFSVQVGDAAGCLSAASGPTALAFHETPQVTLTQEGTRLKATPGFAFYAWTKDGVTLPFDGADITPQENGNYQVDASTAFGCHSVSNEFAFTLPPVVVPPVIEPPVVVPPDSVVTGIEAPNADAIKVYPNPFAHGFYIEAPGAVRSVQLIDHTGRTLRVFNDLTRDLVNVEEIPAGHYILIITTGGNTYHRSVVKTL
ncbi:MAG TPA: PKD domain-containing protein [Chryseolinea sp.]